MSLRQQQFLNVIDRDEAERRFHAALDLQPLAGETIPLAKALGRALAEDVLATVDVPGFDRSNVDGFAVRAADTIGADEEHPRNLRVITTTITPGYAPTCEVTDNVAIPIATGAMLPRGADAVVMIEQTDLEGEDRLHVHRAVTAGSAISYAGTDVASGETVMVAGHVLTSRDTGVLAAIGQADVRVTRRVRVAIISTGDELIAPGTPMQPGSVYDSNSQILADAVRELGAEPVVSDIVQDDTQQLRDVVRRALDACDVVLLSGGTSKGEGDLCYHVIAEMTDPGIVAHGVALKPGKPICLAVEHGKPVVILPGFPTSAIFTFHEFVAPVLRKLGGRPEQVDASVRARLAVKVQSVVGRTEYLLVGLVPPADGSHDEPVVAYPMGKGSGSVTTFSRADGFVTIGRHEEILEAGAIVDVRRIGRSTRVADLTVIGSHCVGLDYLLGRLQRQGFETKFLVVGSMAGLAAAQRGECDVAGIHLLDPTTEEYNRPFLTDGLTLLEGYGRHQGIVYRRGDARFEGHAAEEAIARVRHAPDCLMVNRNQGSGTRILIDRLLGTARPPGYPVQSRSHNAVAAAVAQGRADWGVAIASVATHNGLGFLPLCDERYDFVVPKARERRAAVEAFQALLQQPETRIALKQLGLLI